MGGGKMQWYGFHKEPAGGTDNEGERKARLLRLFGHWSENVVDLIKATPEEDILRRDIFDRWGRSWEGLRVTETKPQPPLGLGWNV